MPTGDEPKVDPPVNPAPVVPGANPSTQGVVKPNATSAPTASAEKVGQPQTPSPQTANVKTAPPGEKLPEPQPSVANRAPAASTDNPFRVRRRALEEQLKKQQEDKSRHAAHGRATTAAMLAELKDQEARYGHSGLSPKAPRGNLLQAGAIQAQYPDDHLRWVNETIPGRTALLTSLGYERVPGQITGGDTVLWKVPREKWASGAAAKEAETERTLRKATQTSRADTVQELQSFFDKHGVNVDVDRIISREA